jgi:Family of unknown function (DUF6065)
MDASNGTPESHSPVADSAELSVFRLHPDGVRISRAERLLNGEHVKSPMMRTGLRHCGPLSHANSSGWWIFSPLDVDITYLGEGKWEYEPLSSYALDEIDVVRGNLRPGDRYRTCGRTHISVGTVEPDTVQIWTGCIFRTPRNCVLLLTTPINFVDGFRRPFHVQQAVLETDWLPYDIWLNIKFHRVGERAAIRRADSVPLAQLIPMSRAAYDRELTHVERVMDRTDPVCDEMWTEWQQYNYEKWIRRGEKDPLTYYRTRRRAMAERLETREVAPSE